MPNSSVKSKTRKKRRIHSPADSASDQNNTEMPNSKGDFAESSDTDVSGIISDDCLNVSKTKNTNVDCASGSNLEGPGASNNTAAETEINSEQKFFLTSLDHNIKLAFLNPILLKKTLINLVGKISKIGFLKSRSLFITSPSALQNKILNTNEIYMNNKKISIKFEIANSEKSIQGKIYAPNLLEAAESDIIEELKNQKVMKFEKLLKDPTKSNVPLFLITFSGSKCPDFVEIAFCRYKVDQFIPNPFRCSNCCRYGHTKGICKSNPICAKCGQKGHNTLSCSSTIVKCPHCAENHVAFSLECQKTIDEKAIIKIKYTEGISYQAARDKYLNPILNNQASLTLSTSNDHHFPNLVTNNNQNPIELTLNSSIPNNQAEWYGNNSNPRNSNNISSQLAPTYSQITSQRPKSQIHQVLDESSQINLDSHQPSQPNISPHHTASFHPSSRLPAPSSLNTSSHLHDTSRSPQSNLQFNSPATANFNNHNYAQNHSIHNYSIMNVMIPLIPILIKLLFSGHKTSKIECLKELGIALNIENLIEKALIDQNISSIINNES